LLVTTADGTSHLVLSQGTLHTSRFRVPSVSHVPDLNLQLLSTGQIIVHDCRIILESDSCLVQDRHTRTLVVVGTDRRLCDPPRLWELDWVVLPSTFNRAQSPSTTDTTAFATTTSVSFAQWHHHLGHMCGPVCHHLFVVVSLERFLVIPPSYGL
jgi:hypothetical protein